VRADLNASVEHYNQLARDYDHATRLINSIRLRTIAALNLKAGECVLDAGCGTGWCLKPLVNAVGETGHVIGFEPAGAMLDVARNRVAEAGWKNITLLQADGLNARLTQAPHAVLFSYTHDLTQSRESLINILGQCQPGARVAATSTKLYAPWFAPGNWWLKWRHQGYITDFTGFDAPWRILLDLLDNPSVETGPLTQHYIATGRVNLDKLARLR
jgi:SAM-dependent methyltransferase